MARSAVAFWALALLMITSCTADNAIVAFVKQAQGRVREHGLPNQAAARVTYAGHTVLNLLFPWAFYKHDAALKNFTADLTAEEKAAASKAGRDAGIRAVKDRLTDGFDVWAEFTPAPAGSVGEYQFTPNQTYALVPQLAKARTYFPPPNKTFEDSLLPHPITSPEYTAELEEIYRVGGKNSTERSQYDTETALFWDIPLNTSSVSGLFNTIAQTLLPANTSLYDTALLFARLNVAGFDGVSGAWRVKYRALSWRPVTAIREGDGTSQNEEYVDPQWTPLLPTPPHPEYVAGHTATAAAQGAVLSNFLGTDNVKFTVASEVAGLSPRTYASLSQASAGGLLGSALLAVEEAGDSRVLGGVHFRKAVEDGATLGYQIGNNVYTAIANAKSLGI
ncbi:hypothetical protein N2152v2_002980 [Parachlorella kessleri]